MRKVERGVELTKNSLSRKSNGGALLQFGGAQAAGCITRSKLTGSFGASNPNSLSLFGRNFISLENDELGCRHCPVGEWIYLALC